MPSRVIALIYVHNGDHNYHNKSTSVAKALLRKANKAITEHYGFSVGTSFGDPRGRDENGKIVRAYAQCMTTTEANVDWLIETFWAGGSGAWQEQIPGVGYMGKGNAKAPMFMFDTSKGDAEVQSFLKDVHGIAWDIPKPKVDEKAHAEQATRLSTKTDDDDPLMAMEIDELRKLCDAAEIEYEEDDSQKMLRNLYAQSLEQ